MNSQVGAMKHSHGFSYFLRHPSKFLKKCFLEASGQVNPMLDPAKIKVAGDLAQVWGLYDETSFNQSKPDMYTFGGSKQRERLAAVAELSASKYQGDLVEIGAQNGFTTKLLAPVARKYGRKVIVIDPWMEGSQDCLGKEFQTFQESISGFQDVVEVWRSSSLEPEVIERLKEREICFSFVDGLHTLKACLSDILAVGHTHGVIAIDDTNYNHDLTFAVRRGANALGRTAYQDPSVRESYILKDDLIGG